MFFKAPEDLKIKGVIIKVKSEERYLVKVKINVISGDIVMVSKLTKTKKDL